MSSSRSLLAMSLLSMGAGAFVMLITKSGLEFGLGGLVFGLGFATLTTSIVDKLGNQK